MKKIVKYRKSELRSSATRFARTRQRGSLLLDGILFLSIVAGAIGLTATIVSEENKRQENALTAVSLRQVTVAAQNFVAENYDALRIEAFTEAQGGGLALLPVDMQRLADDGYLPPILLNGSGNVENIFEQGHTLLIRGVDRSDGSNPQSTLTNAILDPGTTGNIDPVLLDRDPSNGEYELEAILVTNGGDPIPPHRGGPMVTRTELPTIGFVSIADQASGAFGNFTLDLSEYQDFDPDLYPEIGRFVAVVAMSNFGVLNSGDGSGDSDLTPAFLRCADIDAVIDAVSYNECLANTDNEVYSNLVFNTYTDSSGDTVFPGIQGLTNVTCDNNDPSVPVVPGRLLIDCSVTDMTGSLNVGNTITVDDGSGTTVEITSSSVTAGDMVLNQDNLSVAGFNAVELLPAPGIPGTDEVRLNGDRIIMNGNDLGEIILDSQVVLAGDSIAKPACGFTAAGDALVPTVYATPYAYADARGRSIVGVRATTTDTGSDWRIRMFNFIEEDFCASEAGGVLIPIPASGLNAFYGNGAPDNPNCTTFTETPVGSDNWVIGTDRSDGLVDVYEIDGDYGASLVQTRCTPAIP